MFTNHLAFLDKLQISMIQYIPHHRYHLAHHRWEIILPPDDADLIEFNLDLLSLKKLNLR